MTMDDDAKREENRALVEAVIAKISAGEFDRVGDHLADDLVFELPYGPEFIPNPVVGLAAWNQLQSATFPLFRDFTLQLVAMYDCVDPDLLIAEYRSDAVVVRNGNAYRNEYVGVFRFGDGKIAAWKEFHNPEATSVL
jgi:ketosteroid isomerase-like protein